MQSFRPPRARLERDEEGETVIWAEANGWMTRKIAFPDARGGPDRIYFRPGILVWMEHKKDGEKPRPQQERRASELRVATEHVYWAENAQDAIAILRRVACRL